MKRPPQPRDRIGKLLAAILVGAGIAVVGFGLRYYQANKRETEQAARATLDVVADLKVAQIDQWRRERLADANWILRGSLVGNETRRLLANPTNESSRLRLTNWLTAWQQFQASPRILLLDTTGTILQSVPTTQPLLGPRERALATQAVMDKDVQFSDLQSSTSTPGTMTLCVFAPVIARGEPNSPDEIVGVLMTEIDPQAFLFPLIESWPTPSLTAETLLIRRDGDGIVYLNELRHRKDTALKLKRPLTELHLPAVQAVLGRAGVVEGIDYRGVPTLAALRPVPNSPWFIVAKQDRAEILAPLSQQAWTTGVMTGALILAVLLGLALLWRRRERLFNAQELAGHRASEARLQASERMFRSLFTSMNEGAALHELIRAPNGRPVDYRIVELNPAFERHTGIPATKALRALASELYVANPPPFLARYAEVATTGTAQTFETDYTPLARQFRVSVYSPATDQFATVFQDITERKHAEQEREALLGEVERINAELERLIYVASHDLRSPLVNLQGFGQRLEKSCEELAALLAQPEVPDSLRAPAARIVGERIPGALKYIRSSTTRMDALINGLLKMSRLGHVTMAIESLALDRLVREAVAAQTYQIQAAGAEVQVEPLPPCRGDGNLLGQVFANLLDNALKYRDPSRPLRVRISGQVDAGRVVYCVADNGLGIAPEHQDKIWEMFHRLNPGDTAGGEGLGLNLVRRIVDRHRGRVWVESASGQGSRFFVSLPAV